jgi:hypothetical protein
MMKTSMTKALLVGMTCMAMMGTAHAANVALSKTVAAKGSFFVGGWGNGLVVDYSTLTDGMIFPTWHQWDQGAVWWDSSKQGSTNNALTVYLGNKNCNVSQVAIQADNNDDYKISWEDVNSGHQEVIAVPDRYWGLAKPTVIAINALTNAFTMVSMLLRNSRPPVFVYNQP